MYVYRFVLSEQPADLTAGEGDGLGGQSCGVDVAAHQNIHLLFRLHLRLLGGGGRERERQRESESEREYLAQNTHTMCV